MAAGRGASRGLALGAGPVPAVPAEQPSLEHPPRLGLADLRWWTRRHAGPIVRRWPMLSWLTVGKEAARVARTCRRRAVAFAGWNAACVPLNWILFGNLLWVLMAGEAALQCLLQWHLWRRHADAFEDRIRDRQRLAGEWLARRRAAPER